MHVTVEMGAKRGCPCYSWPFRRWFRLVGFALLLRWGAPAPLLLLLPDTAHYRAGGSSAP